jgi:hypothetical protein
MLTEIILCKTILYTRVYPVFIASNMTFYDTTLWNSYENALFVIFLPYAQISIELYEYNYTSSLLSFVVKYETQRRLRRGSRLPIANLSFRKK